MTEKNESQIEYVIAKNKQSMEENVLRGLNPKPAKALTICEVIETLDPPSMTYRGYSYPVYVRNKDPKGDTSVKREELQQEMHKLKIQGENLFCAAIPDAFLVKETHHINLEQNGKYQELIRATGPVDLYFISAMASYSRNNIDDKTKIDYVHVSGDRAMIYRSDTKEVVAVDTADLDPTVTAEINALSQKLENAVLNDKETLYKLLESHPDLSKAKMESWIESTL